MEDKYGKNKTKHGLSEVIARAAVSLYQTENIKVRVGPGLSEKF